MLGKQSFQYGGVPEFRAEVTWGKVGRCEDILQLKVVISENFKIMVGGLIREVKTEQWFVDFLWWVR